MTFTTTIRGQGCSLFAATPTTFFWKEPMQPTRQAPQGSVPPTGQGEGLPRPFFHQREAHLRLPPPFCFFAPETSKPTPDPIATLVVTQSASPLRCSTTNCSTVSHTQFTCSGLHRSNLLNRWQCPPHGGLAVPANNNSLRQLPTSNPPRHQAPRLRCPGLPGTSPRCEAVQRCCHPSR